jgi:hypothetical protein
MNESLARYLRRIPELSGASTPSVFWQRLLERDGLRVEDPEAIDLDRLAELVAAGGYGFEPLPDGVERPRDDRDYIATWTKLKQFRREAKTVSAKGLGISKESWEHLRGLDFLEHEGLLQDYLAAIEPLRIRSGLFPARHWYYARWVTQLLEHAPAGRRGQLRRAAGGLRADPLLHDRRPARDPRPRRLHGGPPPARPRAGLRRARRP